MDLVLSIAIFLGLGVVLVLSGLLIGKVVRPRAPHPQKAAPYECGEVPLGANWVQFDLRFYIVALFYLVFDVEVALIYAWAVVYREFPVEALVLGLPFIGVVVVGYVYEWCSGSLDWVRSSVSMSVKGAAGTDLARLARTDPETLEQE